VDEIDAYGKGQRTKNRTNWKLWTTATPKKMNAVAEPRAIVLIRITYSNAIEPRLSASSETKVFIVPAQPRTVRQETYM
jgi:hypothetical protein